MSIKAILYSKFDPLEGPKIVHQVPEDSVLTSPEPSASNHGSALLSFPTISRFLIPRQSLCGNLISLTPPPLTSNTPSTLILSYPVCLTSSHYPRNEFIFNFALVLSPPDTIDIPSYKSVVTKLAQLMRSLEEQSHFLSDDDSAPGTGKVYSLCETLMEDLNNYCECMIPIDEINTLNIKLFPTLPNPAPVKPWHVPLFTVRIETLMDENWDLTMQRIIPYINGVNSVKRIAGLADADIKLTKKCIRHLLYYGCVLLLDIFHFGAIYAPTAEFTSMIASDSDMQAECARYINTAFEPARQEVAVSTAEVGIGGSSSMRSSNVGAAAAAATAMMMLDHDFWPLTGKGDALDGVSIVQLYANLRQGLTVRDWCKQNTNMLSNIDVRRFLTFGIIKGFLYRVHRYALQTSPITNPKHQHPPPLSSDKKKKRETKKQIPTTTNHSDNSDEASSSSDDEDERDLKTRLSRFLDGTHCFDEICTDLCMSEKELMERLARPDMGEVVVICK